MWEHPVPNDSCNCPVISDRNPWWHLETIQKVGCYVDWGAGLTRLPSPSEMAVCGGPWVPAQVTASTQSCPWLWPS